MASTNAGKPVYSNAPKTAGGSADTDQMTSRLRSFVLGIQVAAVLLLIGGSSGIGARLTTGEWLPIIDRVYPGPVSALVSIVLVAFAVSALVLAPRIKRGNTVAAKWVVWMSMVLFACSILHLLATGRGWYEALFGAFIVGDSLVALSYAQKIGVGCRDADFRGQA